MANTIKLDTGNTFINYLMHLTATMTLCTHFVERYNNILLAHCLMTYEKIMTSISVMYDVIFIYFYIETTYLKI